MAHKTLIGGISYDISGGKTLVDGTSYSIAGGKTLVGGTTYDINFDVDLAALFRGMTVLHVEGRNGSSRQGINFYAGDYVSKGSTAYVLSFCYGYMSIFKVVIGSTITPIYRSNESFAGLSMSYSGIISYYHGVDTTPPSSSGYNTTSVNGATLALVQFNQPEEKVDTMLSSLQHKVHTGVNTSSKNYVYLEETQLSEGDFVFAAYSNYFEISRVITQITGDTTYAPERLCYYGDNPTIYVDTTYGVRWYVGQSTLYSGTMHVAQYTEQ